MSENKYPSFESLLSDFLYEEEANISRKKIVAVGTTSVRVLESACDENGFLSEKSKLCDRSGMP